MKTLAVLDETAGGVGTCADGSHKYQPIFCFAPPDNMDARPDTSASLLECLSCRSIETSRFATADSYSRDYQVTQSQLAYRTLANSTYIVMRRIALDAIKQPLLMYYQTQKVNIDARKHHTVNNL